MTPLLVAAVLVVVTGASGSFLRRRRSAGRTTRRQRQALETLGHISSAPRPVETVTASQEATRQAHVRVVAADAAPPLPTPKPLAGGWRPTRATGAAPFRQPTPRGAHTPMGPDHAHRAADPGTSGGLLDFAVDASPDEGVRVVRPSPAAPGTTRAPDPARAEPEATTPPAAQDMATSATLHFDDLDPAPPPADAPDEPLAGVVGTPTERAAWAEKLATAGAAGAAARQAIEAETQARRSHRRRRRHPTQHQIFVAVGLVAAVVAAAGAAWATGIVGHAARHPAAAATTPVRRHHHHHASRKPVITPPPKTSVAVRLVSNSVGVSVYQLSGPAKITLSASGPCWVEIKSGGDTGPTVYEATLQSGQTTSVTGPVWVRLGNPTEVAITVAGEKLSPPVTAAVPYDLVFE